VVTAGGIVVMVAGTVVETVEVGIAVVVTAEAGKEDS